MKVKAVSMAAIGVLLAGGVSAEVMLRDDFSANAPGEAVPSGWQLYKQGPNTGKISIRDLGDGKRELLIDDECDQSEIGVTRQFPATAGNYYRIALKARQLNELKKDPAYFQLRFLPSQKLLQRPITVLDAERYNPNMITLQAPAGTTGLQIFIYTHKAPKPAVAISEFQLDESATPFTTFSPWPNEQLLLKQDPMTELKLDEKSGAPVSWGRYTQGPNPGTIEVTSLPDGKTALKMVDNDNQSEIGVQYSFSVTPGLYYQATVDAKNPTEGQCFLLQLSMFPGKQHKQVFFTRSDDFKTYTVTVQAPEDATKGVVYIYSHKAPTGSIELRNFRLEQSERPFTETK